jgi:hypothetical protein
MPDYIYDIELATRYIADWNEYLRTLTIKYEDGECTEEDFAADVKVVQREIQQWTDKLKEALRKLNA